MIGKISKIGSGFLITALLLVALTGCGESESGVLPDYDDTMAEEALLAFNNGDYAAYSEHFDETTKMAITKEVFEGTRDFIKKRVGDYKSKKVTKVQVEGVKTTVTYKATFSDEPDGVNFMIIFQEKEGGVYIAGLSFDSPKLRGQ